MKTITATVPAWLAGAGYTIKDMDRMTPERAISAAICYKPHGNDNPEGWVKIGTAEVTITFADEAEIVGQQIATLRAAKQKVQADCEVALMQLDGQIQSLLAIECQP